MKYDIIYADSPYQVLSIKDICALKVKKSPKIGKKSWCELCLIATRGKDAHKLVVNHKINSFLSNIQELTIVRNRI